MPVVGMRHLAGKGEAIGPFAHFLDNDTAWCYPFRRYRRIEMPIAKQLPDT